MSNDAVYNFLFFVLLDPIDVARAVHLGFTTRVALATVQNLIDVHCLITAAVFVGAIGSNANLGLWRLLMVPAIPHFGNGIVVLTKIAPYEVQITPNLPIYFLPTDPVGFPYECYELLKVPVPINDVFGSELSVCVDTLHPSLATEHFPLLFGEQFVAITTFIQIVFFFFEQKFEFLHEEPRDDLVLSFFQTV